jgi:hypothetical protein
MSSSESESEWSEASEVETRPERMRRNDESLTVIVIEESCDDIIEVLDALKNNTVVMCITYFTFGTESLPVNLNQAALVKLSEAMKCNKSVEWLTITLKRGLLRESLFATMATSGGWSSIQKLTFNFHSYMNTGEPLSFTEAKHISRFIMQSENLRTLSLSMAGDEAAPIVEMLSRTKVQSLTLDCASTIALQNGGMRIAAALERCTCITELKLNFFPSIDDRTEVIQILFLESIPKMLGLKKLEFGIMGQVGQGFADMVGRCIGGHQGEIERLTFDGRSLPSENSLVGLAPALRRLKVIQFYGDTALTVQHIRELSGVAAECDTLEEFGYNLSQPMPTDDFKAICQLLSKFPSLKRVKYQFGRGPNARVGEDRFTAVREMVKTSKTIEKVPYFLCGNAEEKAAIEHYCRNNIIHNRIERIRKKGLLAAKVLNSAWPLILQKFSDMPDVLYFLLQQKNGAMIGPTRKQDFDD